MKYEKKCLHIPHSISCGEYFFDIDSLFPQSFLSILLGVVRVDPTIIPSAIKGRKKYATLWFLWRKTPLKKATLKLKSFYVQCYSNRIFIFLVVLRVLLVYVLALFLLFIFFFSVWENVYAKMANFLFQKTTHNTVFWFW